MKRRAPLLLVFSAVTLFFAARCDDSDGSSDAAADGDTAVEECLPPLVLCGDQCVDVQRDNDNCSACGYVCPIITACRSGICVRICEPPCLAPRVCCEGECYNVTNDRWHCGGCGACGMMEVCVDGECVTMQ